ncbi:TPA: hypothetical protein ND482_003299 [Citrobacter farmeri]|nr:hypothetical protein [Citrobacter farmeri]
MHRIDTPTAQKDKFGQGKNGYTDGDPNTGVKSTQLNAAIFDALQEEIANAIEKSGVALNPGDNTQLYQVLSGIKGALGDYLAKSKNLSEIKDAGAGAQSSSRSNIGCGTAATHDVTTSHTDSTGSRVLQVGDFGVGGSSVQITNMDFNKLFPSGFVNGQTNTPISPSLFLGFNALHGNTYQFTLVGRQKRYFAQTCEAGTFQGWDEFYTTSHKPTAKDTGAIPFTATGLSVDLNTLDGTKAGRYFQQASAGATAAYHYPELNAGTLDVYYNHANGEAGCVQEYRPFNSSSLYRRWYNLVGGSWVWSAWTAEYNTGNLDLSPYMTVASANAKFVQDVRLGGTSSTAQVNDMNRVPNGCVMVGIDVSGGTYNPTTIYYQPIQKFVNNNWYNVVGM